MLEVVVVKVLDATGAEHIGRVQSELSLGLFTKHSN